MIDMVFILLIFFIVTTVFVDEKGISVDKPQPAPPENKQQEKKDPVIFRIQGNGQILHNNQQVTLAQVEKITKDRLSRDDVPVILEVQRTALAGKMVQVIDHARMGKADKVSVTSVD